jgi:hypothetical protein
MVGVNTPEPWQVWHVSDPSLEAILPVPLQLGQTIFPVPWHVEHSSASADATFKAEKRKTASNATISSLLFKSSHLFANLSDAAIEETSPYKHLEAYYN